MKKWRNYLAVAAAVFLTLSFLPLPACAQDVGYREDLHITVFGSKALWQVELRGGDITSAKIQDVEQQLQAISFYEVAVTRVNKWSPDYELLVEGGVRLLRKDQLVSQSLLLTIRSTTATDAESAAQVFDELFKTHFIPYGVEGEVHQFISPINFNIAVKEVFLPTVPEKVEGFDRLLNMTRFFTLDFQRTIFRGEKAGGDFVHTLLVSGIESGAVQSGLFKLSQVLNTASSVKASTISDSSTISVTVLGGLVKSVDAGEFVNRPQNLTAELRLSVARGTTIKDFKMALVQSFPSLLVTRDVVGGSLSQGDTAEVRITVTNFGPVNAPPAENVTISEEWWKPYFELVAGAPEIQIPSLSSNKTTSTAYELKTRTSEPRHLVLGESENRVSYSYKIGDTVFNESAFMNEAIVNLNSPGAAVSVRALSENSNPPVGSVGPVLLTATNSGDRSAFNLILKAGNTVIDGRDSLLPGSSWSANFTQTSIMNLFNQTYVWQLEWLEEGQLKTVRSNDLRFNYRMSSLNIPSLVLEKKSETYFKDDTSYVNTTITVQRQGTVDPEKVLVSDLLPQGYTYVNGSKGVQLVNDYVSAEVISFDKNGNAIIHYLSIVKGDENTVAPPAKATYTSQKREFVAMSPPEGIPAGIRVYKTFLPDEGFVGTNATVKVEVVNRGRVPIYDVHLLSGPDGFAEVLKGNTSATSDTLRNRQSVSATYVVNFTSPGKFNISSRASFQFAGLVRSIASRNLQVKVHLPPTALISFLPSTPVEAKPFTLVLAVSNPSPVQLEKVSVRTALPPEIELVKGQLSTEIPELAANETRNFSVEVVCPTALELQVPAPSITFEYNGATFTGLSKGMTVPVADDVGIRYAIPIAIALAAMFATVFIVKRKSSSPAGREVKDSTFPSSPPRTP